MDKSALAKVVVESHHFSGNYYGPFPFSTQTLLNLKFETFFHSHIAEFIKGLNRKGIPGLLNLSNQTLGNPYLHSTWKFGYTISTSSTSSSCIIEGGFGRKFNKNPQDSQPGNFEAVILEGNNLWHYWHDSFDVTKPWTRANLITDKATGPGCIIERLSTRVTNLNGIVNRPGDFEVIVQQGNDLHHYTHDNTNPANSWVLQGIITHDAKGPGCIIETVPMSATINNSQLEVIVLEGNQRLAHYVQNNITKQWFKQGTITDNATGAGSIIQSSFTSGSRNNFEVAVLEGNQLVHYSKDHAKNEWRKVSVITDVATSAGWIIQSRVSDSLLHGNFEVVVCEGNQLIHYWKDNSDPGTSWRRGQVITRKASNQGCIIHGSFGSIGNFEVIVPEENGRLVHYWNVNEGQKGSEGERYYFAATYSPSEHLDDPYPRHDLDFSYGSAYSLYNWEIFFHAPMMLATQLSKNQRFADAMRWYHYIFDPTDDSHELTTHRYWKFLPFRDTQKQRIDHMLEILDDPLKKGSPERQKIEDQLDDWGRHPFQPHRIARTRLIAYQKNVVMKYIDNLIAWGDQLFRRDTIESINEATQLYILAANLLGPRPQRTPQRGKSHPQTYAQLRPKIDEFGNAKKVLENEFPFSSSIASVQVSNETIGLLGMGDTLYFCIPQNDKLLGYWDVVADRLFKIRNCMNIGGVVRQLPLFEPPIDPALLIQAAAKGVDISSVLSDLSSPLPYYRFSYVLQKALEICSELRSLGTELLAALEKKDVEALVTVRAKHETEILNMVLLVKNRQYDEANAAKISLESSRKLSITRYLHYQRLLGVVKPEEPKLNEKEKDDLGPSGNYNLESGEEGIRLTGQEKSELDLSSRAADNQENASDNEMRASILSMIPGFGAHFSPFGTGGSINFGGSNLASGVSAIARRLQGLASKYTSEASKSAKIGSVVIREREWILQNNLAAKEITQIDKQMAVADIRITIAEQEVKNHNRQIEHAQSIEDFLHNKYTNEELYSWMQGEISTIYFQCYQFAYDLAKRAERCYQFERGITNSNFIQFGYWDSLNKGLLSGERLYFALKQLEQAYHDQNKREYEITKSISLVLHDPLALIKLKETGECIVELPEALFDADYPGHYMRRIKSASLTIPCVVGPYTSINCTLTLLANKIRIDNNAQTDYSEQEDDSRFVTNFSTLQSIATSHAQNDSGMFELNFRDERYLPFEGAGVIDSRWRIEMLKDNNAFDFKTISDVIIKLNYTAREGGEALRQRAQGARSISPQENIVRMFSAKHEFPNEWYRFLNPTDSAATSQSLQLGLTMERFPFSLRGMNIQIDKVGVFLNFKQSSYTTEYKNAQPLHILLESKNTTKSDLMNSDSALNDIPSAVLPDVQAKIPDSLKFTVDENNIKDIAPNLRQTVGQHVRLNADAIDDLFVICWYSVAQ